MEDTAFTIKSSQITKSHNKEMFAWSLFLRPFSVPLWIVLALHAWGLVLVLRVLRRMKKSQAQEATFLSAASAAVKEFLAFFASYFGRGTGRGRDPHFPILLFGFALTGTVVWGSYRASLTSLLSVREYRLPFSNLNELAFNADYRYMPSSMSKRPLAGT